MPPVEPELPVPRRRLWRTKLRWSRDVTRFAPPIAIDPAIANEIPERELSHWGEVALLEDYLTVLHRDGTVTYRRSWLFVLHGVKQMERWERFKYHFDCRAVKYTVRRARVHWADGNQRLATITNRAVDRHGYSRLLEVQFKRLAPGAVVDVEDQQDNFAPFSHCPGVCADFALHSTYPCKRRRITLAVAAPFTVRHELHHGAPDPSQRQVGDYQVLCWDLHDLPGIEWDELTPPLYEFAPWIDFSTLPNWEPVAKFYIAELKLLAYHHDLGTLARRLARAGAGTDSRLAAAYNYVARKFP